MIYLFNSAMPGYAPRIGTIPIDGYLTENPRRTAKIPTRKVESGYKVSDGIELEPLVLDVTGIVSATNFEGDGMSKVAKAYRGLKQIYNSASLVSVATGLEVYRNMAIESLSFPREYRNVGRLDINITFKQVRISSTSQITITEEAKLPEILAPITVITDDYEPIHYPGSTMPNGAFAYRDKKTGEIYDYAWNKFPTYAEAHAFDKFPSGGSVKEGKNPLDTVTGTPEIKAIDNAMMVIDNTRPSGFRYGTGMGSLAVEGKDE